MSLLQSFMPPSLSPRRDTLFGLFLLLAVLFHRGRRLRLRDSMAHLVPLVGEVRIPLDVVLPPSLSIIGIDGLGRACRNEALTLAF